MAQEQYIVQAGELDELTKRHHQLYDQYTRVDLECNRATEDLVTANGRNEQLRNECANLRAEKKIWEVSSHSFLFAFLHGSIALDVCIEHPIPSGRGE